MTNGALDRDGAARLCDEISRKLAEAERERDRFARIASGYQTMHDGLLQVFPDLAPTGEPQGGDEDAPDEADLDRLTPRELNRTTSAREAGVGVINEHPGEWLSVRRIYSELGARQVAPQNESALRVALRRAAANGEIEKGELDGRSTAYRSLRGSLTFGPAPMDTEAARVSAEAASDSTPASDEGGEAHGTEHVHVHDDDPSGEAIHRVRDLGAPVVAGN